MGCMLVNYQESVGIIAGNVGVCDLEKCRRSPLYGGVCGFVHLAFERNDFACFGGAEQILCQVVSNGCLAGFLEREVGCRKIRHFRNAADGFICGKSRLSGAD